MVSSNPQLQQNHATLITHTHPHTYHQRHDTLRDHSRNRCQHSNTLLWEIQELGKCGCRKTSCRTILIYSYSENINKQSRMKADCQQTEDCSTLLPKQPCLPLLQKHWVSTAERVVVASGICSVSCPHSWEQRDCRYQYSVINVCCLSKPTQSNV